MVMRLALLALAGRRPVALVLAQGTALGQRPEVALPRVLELALGRLASLVLWWPARRFAQSMRTEPSVPMGRSAGRTVLGQLLEGSNYLD